MDEQQQGREVEPRSSVAIEQNSKGEPAVKVKVYVGEPGVDNVDHAALKAVAVYRQVVAEIGA